MRADWEREALAALEMATREGVITHDQMVTIVGDTLEPLIRADERAHQGALFLDASGVGNVLAASIQEAIRADLRARVEALDGDYWDHGAVRRSDVLALLDGSSDE